jgi:hypothetical protein
VTECRNCGANIDNGLLLCEACRAAASVYLEFLPVYFRNLARWKPARAGGRPVPGSRPPQSPGIAADDRITRALDAAGGALAYWTHKLATDRGLTPPDADDESAHVAALCRWFAENLTTIAALEWAGEFINDEDHGINHHEARLRRLTMQVAPGWYAGRCRQTHAGNQCDTPTHVVPGLTWVTCVGCGTTTYARDHLEVVIDEARDWIAPPLELAKAVVALVGTEASVPRLHKRISKWGERGRIEVFRSEDADGDPVGPKRFQFGAVLVMLEREGPTLKAG